MSQDIHTTVNGVIKRYENVALLEVVNHAKTLGYKVYTFESSSTNIKQIFIESNEGLGSCSVYYGGVQFSTLHKSLHNSNQGTGYGNLVKGEEFNTIEHINSCFITYPYWIGRKLHTLKKYTSMQDYRENAMFGNGWHEI